MAKVIFRESDHSYWLGEKKLISVTQLLKKHGLSTDYSGIDPDVLQRAADKGNTVHKEIEEYIKNGEVGFTSELADYISITEELRFMPDDSEVVLPAGTIPDDKIDEHFLAGTADLIGYIHRAERSATVLMDIKTTVKPDIKACAWQLSLYEHLAGFEFSEMYMLHLGEKSKLIPIERIDEAELNRLLECELNGEIYQEKWLMVEQGLIERAQQAELILKRAEVEKAAAETKAKEYREMLYDAMGKQRISSWETQDKAMLITRIEPTQRVVIDSKKLEKERPDIVAKYSRTSNVKGYVRITLRGE